MAPLIYPSLEYEINTQIRTYRESVGYTQAEFAFLIGRNTADVESYEDLTNEAAYNLNHLNQYARVLGCVPADLVFSSSIPEDDIRILATKTAYPHKIVYRGQRLLDDGSRVKLEPYAISLKEPIVAPADALRMEALLDELLATGYFKEGVTGYELYQHCLQLWGSPFRVHLLANAVNTLSSRRKRPKLLPMRQAPKTAEKWVLYKEDR